MEHYKLREGWLVKRGHMFRTWRRRWFELDGPSLKYYTKAGEGRAKGAIRLHGATVECGPAEAAGARSPALTFVVHERAAAAAAGPDAGGGLSAVRSFLRRGAPAGGGGSGDAPDEGAERSFMIEVDSER